ncbi:hypothetical protein Cgig2_011013 [Carnegiea gigantea]|uniref:FAF domain-containing protein n=1 Tax=Carnegiea gigantea TaxID=171969 RepID=A0A9Q1KH43_9CARY|nr:hypothetical protein Cgig2_011013 [Carnegiea gigantea]
MSTIVYQEVSQSSLSLKLSNPSKLIFSSSTTSHSNNNYDNKYGWGAIEALSCSQKNEPETQYVHPLAKRSSYSKFMSEKSLEIPYREDGRLVMKAVSAPSSNSRLKVERSDGRLRLSLVTDDQDDTVEEETEAEAETAVSMECKFGIDIDEEEGGKERKEEKEREEEEVAVEGKELGGVRLGEDMDGITLKFGGKMGTGEQLQRPNNTSCRCKDGGRGNIKRLINWEPFWVAT